jgi:hypothetical protein
MKIGSVELTCNNMLLSAIAYLLGAVLMFRMGKGSTITLGSSTKPLDNDYISISALPPLSTMSLNCQRKIKPTTLSVTTSSDACTVVKSYYDPHHHRFVLDFHFFCFFSSSLFAPY